jgi:Ran GTPase-activating protein (RanGAP) involved in mRNA processing and transport
MVLEIVEEAIGQMRRGVAQLEPERMLRSGQFDADDVRAIAAELAVNSTLKVLDLGCIGFGDKGAALLAETLARNTTLGQLVIGGNRIGPTGAALLAKALARNTALRQLDVGSNGIRDEGAISLANVLKVNTSLVDLCVSGNSIGDAGASSFAKALRVNTHLRELYLVANSFGDAGVASLSAALWINTGLMVLDINQNYSTTLLSQYPIAEALKHNTTLAELRFDNDFVEICAENYRIAATFSAAIKVNPTVKLPFTAAQRLAFLKGHLGRSDPKSVVAKLPLDMVRRILTRYKVAQGQREWDGKQVHVRGVRSWR